MEENQLAAEIKRLTATIKLLVDTDGKIANAICGLSIYDKAREDMDKEDRETLVVLRTDLAAFTAKVTEWMEGTSEYRRSLCTKVDAIKQSIAELPCPQRKGMYESITKQIGFMWGLLSVIVLALITMGIRAVFAR